MTNEKKMEKLRRDNSEMIEKLSKKLLKSIEQRLDEGDGIDIKDYKAVTGALKELKEMHRADEQKAERKDEMLTVRFLGEAEEMAK